MVNTQLLDEKIEDSGLKIGFIADKIGITRQGFDKKRKNKTPFRISEMYVISDLLKLSEEEKGEIFFANEVNT